MGKEIITQVQETQRVPNRINPRWNTPRQILIKLTKIKHKEQILKAAREKQQITHKGITIRATDDLLIETLQARREWQDVLKVIKENNLQPRLLYPARISFKCEGETKCARSRREIFHLWQRSWGRRLGIHKGGIEPQESPWIFLSIYSPKNQSLPTLLLCALTSDFTGGCPPPPSCSLCQRVNLQLQLIKFLGN